MKMLLVYFYLALRKQELIDVTLDNDAAGGQKVFTRFCTAHALMFW